MYKTLEITYNGEKQKLCIKLANYAANENLAIILLEEATFDTFAYLTVNLPDFCFDGTFGFVDTNDFAGAKDLIEKYKLGYSTGNRFRSGFVDYELYYFDLKEVLKYTAIDWRCINND